MVMVVFTVAVGVSETINLSCTITCPDDQFVWALDPQFLVLVSASQLNF